MGNYIKKAAAHARLVKLASVARLIRRQRAMEKYAQAVYMQKLAGAPAATAGAGADDKKWSVGGKAGLGALIGAGVGGLGGLAFGPEDKKLLATLLGAGGGAAAGAGGGLLAHYGPIGFNKVLDYVKKPEEDTTAPAAAPAAAPAK